MTQATRKDIAEFYRLGLRTGVCDLAQAVRWADRVITADRAPDASFLDLALCSSLSQAVTLLGEVPGTVTPDLPVHLLLGHCARQVGRGALSPLTALRRLWVLATWDTVPEGISLELMRFDDELDLAREGIHGTEQDVARDFAVFLCEFEEWAPEVA